MERKELANLPDFDNRVCGKLQGSRAASPEHFDERSTMRLEGMNVVGEASMEIRYINSPRKVVRFAVIVYAHIADKLNEIGVCGNNLILGVCNRFLRAPLSCQTGDILCQVMESTEDIRKEIDLIRTELYKVRLYASF
jgi:hypothetical protein